MLFFFLPFALAHPSLIIDHNVQDAYLHNEPIVITYTLHNPTDTEITIPDLSYHTWRSSFVLLHAGRKETRNNETKENSLVWTIPPDGRRIFRLEIPGGSTLPVGNYELGLHINYEIDIFTAKKSISILHPKQTHVDIYRTLTGEVSALWTDQATSSTYYHSGSTQMYAHAIADAPKQILHKHFAVYDYYMQNQRLTIRAKRTFTHSIPYPEAYLLGRMAISQNSFVVPLWRPAERILMLLQIDQRGIPVYRKIRHNMPEPIEIDTTLNAIDIPLYLIHHRDGVELVEAQLPKEPSLPLNSHYIHKNTREQSIAIARFAMHPSEGLCIYLIQKEHKQTQEKWINLSGSVIAQKEIHPIDGAILDIYPNENAMFVQKDDGIHFVHTEQNHLLKEKNCVLNKHGVVCFTDGKWIRSYTYK